MSRMEYKELRMRYLGEYLGNVAKIEFALRKEALLGFHTWLTMGCPIQDGHPVII